MSYKKYLVFGLLFLNLNISADMKDIGIAANKDMTAVMDTSLQAGATILACTIVGKGLKASFESFKTVDDKYINMSCAALYTAFLASHALIKKETIDSGK